MNSNFFFKKNNLKKKRERETSLIVQWLRFHASNATSKATTVLPILLAQVGELVSHMSCGVAKNKYIKIKSCLPLVIRFYHQPRHVDQSQ